MKLKILCIGALAALAMPVVATAQTATPDGPFVADGNTNLNKGGTQLACTARFVGNISGGTGQVTSATFSGGTLGLCATVTATNLPWTLTALSTTSVKISGVAVNTPIGNCSPAADLVGTFNNTTHALSFVNQALPPNCQVSGSLTTHDNALTINP